MSAHMTLSRVACALETLVCGWKIYRIRGKSGINTEKYSNPLLSDSYTREGHLRACWHTCFSVIFFVCMLIIKILAGIALHNSMQKQVRYLLFSLHARRMQKSLLKHIAKSMNATYCGLQLNKVVSFACYRRFTVFNKLPLLMDQGMSKFERVYWWKSQYPCQRLQISKVSAHAHRKWYIVGRFYMRYTCMFEA